MNKAAQIILYLFTGLIALIFFILLFFPLDTVIGHFLAKVEEVTKNQYSVSVSEIDASLIFDTEFSDFRVFEKGKEIFYVPNLEVGFSLFSFLGENTDVSFDANYKEGKIQGRVSFTIQGSTVKIDVVDVTIKKVSLSELKFINSYLGSLKYPIKLQGILEGSVYVLLEKNVKTSEAEINLKLQDTKVAAIPIEAFKLEVPEMELALGKKHVEIDGLLTNGTITLNKLSIPGPDAVLDITGTARLNRKFQIIRTTMDGKFSFSEKVIEQFPLISLLDSYKTSDGTFPLSIRGGWKNPKIKVGEMQIMDLLKQGSF